MCARQVELVPGGQHRAVTASNRREYIMRVANFRLNAQIRAASTAFRAGLEAVIERAWIRMFHESELQVRPGPPLCCPKGHLPGAVPRLLSAYCSLCDFSCQGSTMLCVWGLA